MAKSAGRDDIIKDWKCLKIMKSKNINEVIEMMKENNLDAIIFGAESDLPILNLNAVIFGTQNRISSEKYISLLKDKFLKSDISFFGMPFSKIVTAALDVLGVEKYAGNDDSIIRLINSNFIF